jgi:hypothetical protein
MLAPALDQLSSRLPSMRLLEGLSQQAPSQEPPSQQEFLNIKQPLLNSRFSTTASQQPPGSPLARRVTTCNALLSAFPVTRRIQMG